MLSVGVAPALDRQQSDSNETNTLRDGRVWPMARPKKSRLWFGKGAGLVCVSGPNEGLDQNATDGVALLSDPP